MTSKIVNIQWNTTYKLTATAHDEVIVQEHFLLNQRNFDI